MGADTEPITMEDIRQFLEKKIESQLKPDWLRYQEFLWAQICYGRISMLEAWLVDESDS